MTTRAVPFRRITISILLVLVTLIALFGEHLYAQRDKSTTFRIPGERQPITSLRDLNQAFIQIAKNVTPSVVTVSTERTMKVRNNPFMWDPFAQFFGQQDPRGRQQAPEQQLRQMGLGSGVIISDDGYILTNNHVISEADTITVRTSDGRNLSAKVIGADPKTDVAVIKVNARNLTPVRRGNSDDLQVGEMVMAIGSPLNPSLAHTVTQGIVSAVGRSNVGLADYEDFIQTDAAINPGNSGGALVNLDGELIGINTAIASQSGGFQGIGFAVPVNMALDVMDALIKNGKVTRGWLGVSIQDVNEEIARAMRLRENQGVVIGSVSPRGPADRAGLESGDVIVAYNGKDVTSSSQLRNAIARTEPGTSVNLAVLRDGNTRNYNVKLGELPDEQQARAGNSDQQDEEQGGGYADNSQQSRLGFDVANITRDLARRYEISGKVEGVLVVDVDESSTAYSEGLREGDVIRQVNRKAISSVDDFDDAVGVLHRGDSILLLVARDNQGFYMAFQLQ